jgi:HEAT repeat protein
MGDPALARCSEKIRNLNDKDLFDRDPSSGVLSDSAWYIARNCIDVIGKLGGLAEVDLLKSTADDPDFRIRREALSNVGKMDAKEGVFLARLKLNDKEPEVVETAVNVMGNLQARDHADDLIELLFVESRYRSAVIQALAKIGGEKAESLLLAALRFGGTKPAARVFEEDFELRKAAVKALGQIGGKRTKEAFERFLASWENPVTRLAKFPFRSQIHGKQLAEVVGEAMARLRYRMQSSKPATAVEGAN